MSLCSKILPILSRQSYSAFSFSFTFSHKSCRGLRKINRYFTTSMSAYANSWPVKYVYIETCAATYAAHNQVIIENLRQNEESYDDDIPYCPPNVCFNVGYIDTGDVGKGTEKPTILMLHGLPGSHKMFLPILEELVPHARVIIPNFPGFGVTDLEKGNKFQHSLGERAEFTIDFLKALQIKKVNLVVSHSAGCWVALPLLSYCTSPEFHAAAFLNPAGNTYNKTQRPVFIMAFMHALWKRHWLRWILRPLLSFVSRRLGFGGSAEELIHTISTILQTPFPQITDMLTRVDLQRTPTLMIYSDDDLRVEKELSEEFGRLLGINEWDVVNSDGVLDTIDVHRTDLYRRGIKFEGKSHFCFRSDPQITAAALLELLHWKEKKS